EIPVGTTAELTIEVGEPVPASEIPLIAASVRGSSATLFTVEGGQAKKAKMGVKGERGESLFVEPTLKPGTLVVTEGRSLLKDGAGVTPRPDPPARAEGGGVPQCPASRYAIRSRC